MPLRVLIFGATGLLGHDLMRAFSSETVAGLGSKDADIRDAERVREVVQNFCPDWILLPAAQPHVDLCEENPELAFAVNRDGPLNIAGAAQAVGARLLFISTDYVFDGEKRTPYEASDTRNPINVYGRSKAEAEALLLEKMPECCVARVSWLFGNGKKGFPDFILQSAEKGEVRALVDVNSCPTYTVDAARAIRKIVRQNGRGIVHVTNRGVCSRYEFAQAVVEAAGSKARVLASKSEEMPRPAKRPAYSALSGRSLEAYGITLPPWQDGLQRYFAERRALQTGSV